MEDTTQESRQLVHNIVMSKTVEERFLMCAAMYENAKCFARLGMPDGLSAEDQALFVFERLHGALPADSVEGEWLNIVYSGFWDYPSAFAVRYERSVYFFIRGDFDEELDDYPNEYEVIRDNSIDFASLRNNFGIEPTGETIGKVEVRSVQFDPTHRQQIHSSIFQQLRNKNFG